MTIPVEPIYLGTRFVNIKFYAMPRNPGDPQMIAGTLTLMPDEAALTLDALIGPRGPRGLSSPFWRPEFQSTITNPADLPDGLLEADAGRAWYIAGFWHIWDGDNWQVLLGAIPGPPGPTPNIAMTAEQVVMSGGTPYGEIIVQEGGTDENPTYHLLIPGIVGPQGDNSRILESLDFEGEMQDGQTLIWDAPNERFRPGDPTQQIAEFMTVPATSFNNGGVQSAGRAILAAPHIGPRLHAFYLHIGGHIRWQRQGLFNSAQVTFEVRYLPEGSTDAPESGTLVARALYDPATLDWETVAQINPHYSTPANPSRAVSPESEVGRIPKNQGVDIYVMAVRTGGWGNYICFSDDAQLAILMLPVS